jgi:hypothetical protein
MKLLVALAALLAACPFAAAGLLHAPAAAPALGATPTDTLAALAALRGTKVLPVPAIRAGTLRHEILAFYAQVGALPTRKASDELDARLATVPASIQAPTADLLASMNAAAKLRDAAFADVRPSELAWAYARGLDPTPMSLADQARAADIIARIDAAKMDLAARLVTSAVARDAPLLKAQADAPVSFVDPLGAIEIAPATDDVHSVDRTLLIDLGGDDDYTNNAGAAMPDYIIDGFPGCITTGGLDCTLLDAHRNGDSTRDVFGRACRFGFDTAAFQAVHDEQDAQAFAANEAANPSTPNASRYVPVAEGYPADINAAFGLDTGCLPQGPEDATGDWYTHFWDNGTLTDGDEHDVALLVDLGGNDRYAPPREFNNINNGNNAAGCDTRPMGEAGKIWARNLTAGGAFAGVGVLYDASGSDFYGGRSLTQGTGHVGGVGVLIDDGAGDNTFSAVRIAQGTGLFAGLGLLDARAATSNDFRLENDVPFFNEFEHFIGCDVSTRDGQGRGNFNGAGALLSGTGDDTYFVESHDPSVPGAVRDDPTTTQGSGGDRLQVGVPDAAPLFAQAVGILDDAGGHDTYTRADRGDGVTSVDGQSDFVDS